MKTKLRVTQRRISAWIRAASEDEMLELTGRIGMAAPSMARAIIRAEVVRSWEREGRKVFRP